MRQLLITIYFILIPTFLFSQYIEMLEYEKRIRLDSINGIYIPANLDECINQINLFWSDSLKSEFKKIETNEEFVGKLYFEFDFINWIINNWSLELGSRLSVYFYDLGINNPKDMSIIIIKSYYRDLMN